MENFRETICYTRGCMNDESGNSSNSCQSGGCNKLHTHDWLSDIPCNSDEFDIVEVRFKNVRKGFFKNVNQFKLNQGDLIAVESSPGHDIGIVSLVGNLVRLQMKKMNVDLQTFEFKKIYRKAKSIDIEKWKEAISLEIPTMLRARQITQKLKLNMKIGDVEFQGDKTKAIFYYIADERVDFRELIKVLAEEFKVRIEMRQIGARQEAGRIGGIGPCGRELCCTTWLSNFNSVSTGAARYQELSLNPQKLAGQCSKLKCCLNYELDTYLDAIKDFPNTSTPLEVKEGTAYYQKTDVFKEIMWYSFDKNNSINLVPVPVSRVKEILNANKQGIKFDTILIETEPIKDKLDFQNTVGQESITRFDDKRNRKKKKKKYRNPNENQKG
ncbi:MAG: hypothetical protein A2046_11560 [Bacteroidetes bacterium GWA2_30_7]|nr:MAG: hypothetical protein A2046_11560 [Bacteroidetes bacterium GWA2_30_7]